MCCVGLGVCLARTRYPWPPPHFLCLISLFQLSPSCLLFLSRGALCPSWTAHLWDISLCPTSRGEGQNQTAEPTLLLIVQACLPSGGALYIHPVLPACFQEPGAGKAPGMSLGEGLDLTHEGRRKTWLCWVVQPSGSSLPYSPSPCSTKWLLLPERKLADHSKPEPPIPTDIGLWLGTGRQNRDTTRQRSGDRLATLLTP